MGTAGVDVLPSMVKRCLERCDFRKSDADLMKGNDEEDPEFSIFAQELRSDLPVDEYGEFDEIVPTAEVSFDTGKLKDRNPNLNALKE